MNAPSVDIKDILESSQHAVGTFGTDIFVGMMPKAPDACICIYDTGSWRQPETGFSCQYPTIMVKIRGPRGNYTTGYAKAKEVFDALHATYNETWNSTLYVFIIAIQDPFFIGYDENNRPLFSVNFRIERS